jgi:hypothetical protein
VRRGAQRAGNDFFAVAANLTGARNPEAHLEITVDTTNAGDIVFNVYDVNGVQLAEFTLQTNANGFVSSASAAPPNDNLFSISRGQPVLVRARTPGSWNEYAVLRQSMGKSTIVVGIPPLFSQDGSLFAAGIHFPVPLGDFVGAALLVANLGAGDIGVDVFLGTKGPDGTGKYRIPRLKPNSWGILQITDPTDARSHLVLTSTGNIVAQLAIDTGKGIHELTVLPAR